MFTSHDIVHSHVISIGIVSPVFNSQHICVYVVRDVIDSTYSSSRISAAKVDDVILCRRCPKEHLHVLVSTSIAVILK